MVDREFAPGEQTGTLSDGTVIRQARREETSRTKVKPLAVFTARALQAQIFEPPKAPVKGLIVEGLTLLCGASKIGKSWLILDMCCAVASGRPFLGRETIPGDVLYLALEDSEGRIADRLDRLNEQQDDNLCIAFDSLRANNGLLEQLQGWCESVENPQMIVIDTLQKVRGITSGRANAYEQDYALLGQLKKFADTHHIALVLVHHLNKMRDVADPFDRINGSTALMGCADTTILLTRERGSNDGKLTFTGRDVEGDDICMRFDEGRWSVVGQAEFERKRYAESPVVQTIKELLLESFGGRVEVTSEALKESVAERRGVCPAGTVSAMSRMVTAFAPDLLRYDGIVTERPTVNHKRGFRFTAGTVRG